MTMTTTTVGHHVQDRVLPSQTTLKSPTAGQEAALPGEETGMRMMFMMTTAGGTETIRIGLIAIATVIAMTA